MQGLFDNLNGSDSVTIVPASSKDFLDYDALFANIPKSYREGEDVSHLFSYGQGWSPSYTTA
jgi:hypothetical protein